MSQDEWEMFGSDEEDEDEIIDAGVIYNTPEGSCNNLVSDGLDPDLFSSLEKTVNLAILRMTQHFIKFGRNIPLNKRVFGISDYGNPELIARKSFTDETYFNQVWSRLFSSRVTQRCVEVLNFPTNRPDDRSRKKEKTYNSYSCDGAALFRSFRFNIHSKVADVISICPDSSTIGNSFSIERLYSEQLSNCEAKIRRLLVPGGFIMLNISIISQRPIHWSASEFVLQWKDSSGIPIFSEAVWDLEHAEIVNSFSFPPNRIDGNDSVKFCTVFLTKRGCTINTSSCQWKGRENNKATSSSFQQNKCQSKKADENCQSSAQNGQETWIQYERRILEEATISRSIAEREGQIPMTQENIDKAIKSIQQNGFVVIPDFFDLQHVKKWSDAVLSDFESACSILLQKHNVDIRNPGREGKSDPLSYNEIAMREDLRVDIRNGPQIKLLRNYRNEEELKLLNKIGYISSVGKRNILPTIIERRDFDNFQKLNFEEEQLQQSIRFDPTILKIVEAVCNPLEKANNNDEANPPLFKGNFGRWNFEGCGPNGKPQPLRIGQVGAIVSLPGAADQAVHADISHLFENYDMLPCHYVNVFTMGCDSNCDYEGDFDIDGNFSGSNLVGGTAFVHGTHRLSVAARLTAEDGNGIDNISVSAAKKDTRNEMHMRVIRPSLRSGDALIFDCRILHFGLANRSESELRRPMLYVNMTHSWFNDPKNWDERQSVFD